MLDRALEKIRQMQAAAYFKPILEQPNPAAPRVRYGTTYKYTYRNGERTQAGIRNPGYYLHTISTGPNRRERRRTAAHLRGKFSRGDLVSELF